MAASTALISLTAAQTYGQIASEKEQSRYQKQMYENDARLSRLKADDAIRRGETEAAAVRRGTERTAGAQRAAFAAQGIDVNDGSAVDVGIDTQQMGALDELTVKNNAWREAWGFKVQAANDETGARFARLSSRSATRSTLLTGGLQALNFGVQGYRRYRDAGSPSRSVPSSSSRRLTVPDDYA